MIDYLVEENSYQVAFAIAALAIAASAVGAWVAAPRRARAATHATSRLMQTAPHVGDNS